MSKIIDVQKRLDRMAREGGVGDIDFETFLLEEGLDLLATYRSIDDKEVRDAAMVFIASLAKIGKVC